jgi:hypothetical protein
MSVVCGCQALTRTFCPPHLLAELRELLQSVLAGLAELKVGQAELKDGQAELKVGLAELAIKVGKLEGAISLAALQGLGDAHAVAGVA